MVETFGAHYVSLHVRVSNQAAIHLYRDTLRFKSEKTESKYYADGEDAFCMRLDLAPIREQLREDQDGEADGEAADEGEPVGDVGKAGDPEAEAKGKKEAAAAADKGVDKKRKVKVGRALGVGELVERVESKHS
jgi:peptide alpha-N-acetyltransferase